MISSSTVRFSKLFKLFSHASSYLEIQEYTWILECPISDNSPHMIHWLDVIDNGFHV